MREQTKVDHVSSRWKEGVSNGGTKGVENGKKDSLSLEGRICNALNDKRDGISGTKDVDVDGPYRNS